MRNQRMVGLDELSEFGAFRPIIRGNGKLVLGRVTTSYGCALWLESKRSIGIFTQHLQLFWLSLLDFWETLSDQAHVV